MTSFCLTSSRVALLSTAMPHSAWGNEVGPTFLGRFFLGLEAACQQGLWHLSGHCESEGDPGMAIPSVWLPTKPSRAPHRPSQRPKAGPPGRPGLSTAPDARCFHSSLLHQESAGVEFSPLSRGLRVCRPQGFCGAQGLKNTEEPDRKQAGEDLSPDARGDRGLASALDLQLETVMWKLPPTVIIPVVITV